jgi:hypothetical protein
MMYSEHRSMGEYKGFQSFKSEHNMTPTDPSTDHMHALSMWLSGK